MTRQGNNFQIQEECRTLTRPGPTDRVVPAVFVRALSFLTVTSVAVYPIPLSIVFPALCAVSVFGRSCNGVFSSTRSPRTAIPKPTASYSPPYIVYIITFRCRRRRCYYYYTTRVCAVGKQRLCRRRPSPLTNYHHLASLPAPTADIT